jgi:hypothetical protein
MTLAIDRSAKSGRQTAAGGRASAFHRQDTNRYPAQRGEEKMPRGSAQPLEKAQNGQENPSKSKAFFPLIVLARIWPGLGKFDLAWKKLGWRVENKT